MTFFYQDKTQRILEKYPIVRGVLISALALVAVLLAKNFYSALAPHADTAYSALTDADRRALEAVDAALVSARSGGASDVLSQPLSLILIRKSDSDEDGTRVFFDSRYIGVNLPGIDGRAGTSRIILPDTLSLESACLLYNAPPSVLFLQGNISTADQKIQYLDSIPVLCVKYDSQGIPDGLEKAAAAALSASSASY